MTDYRQVLLSALVLEEASDNIEDDDLGDNQGDDQSQGSQGSQDQTNTDDDQSLDDDAAGDETSGENGEDSDQGDDFDLGGDADSDSTSEEDYQEETGPSDQEVEDALQVIGVLEGLAQTLQDSLPSGGVVYPTAVVLESLMPTHLRIDQLPSAIDFKLARKESTQIVLESIEANLRRAFNVAKELLTKALKWLYNFIKNLVDSNNRLEERAQRISRAIDAKRHSSESPVRTVNDPYVFKELQVDGKVTYSNLISTIDELIKANRDAEGLSKVAAALEKSIVDSDGSVQHADKIIDEMVEAIAYADMKPQGMAYGDVPPYIEVKATKELPGGVAIVAFTPKKGLTQEVRIRAISKTQVRVLPYAGSQSRRLAKPIAVLSMGELSELTNRVEQLAKNNRILQHDLEKQAKILQRLLGSLREFVGPQADIKTKDAQQRDAFIRVLASLSSPRMTSVIRYNARFGSACLDYVSVCLRTYES